MLPAINQPNENMFHQRGTDPQTWGTHSRGNCPWRNVPFPEYSFSVKWLIQRICKFAAHPPMLSQGHGKVQTMKSAPCSTGLCRYALRASSWAAARSRPDALASSSCLWVSLNHLIDRGWQPTKSWIRVSWSLKCVYLRVSILELSIQGPSPSSGPESMSHSMTPRSNGASQGHGLVRTAHEWDASRCHRADKSRHPATYNWSSQRMWLRKSFVLGQQQETHDTGQTGKPNKTEVLRSPELQCLLVGWLEREGSSQFQP